MGKIYAGQTALKIDLDTGIDLTVGVDVIKIKFTKPAPDVTVYEWTAAAENTTHAIYYVNGGELDVAGKWTFWSYVTFSDTTFAPGEPVAISVFEEGR